MKKVILFLFFFLVLVLGFMYYFVAGHSHKNSKYGFEFSYDNVAKLEQRGNGFTCGNRYDCASFTGSPNFGYETHYQKDYRLLAMGYESIDVAESSVILYYGYEFRDGKLYKIYESDDGIDAIASDQNSVEQYPFKKEMLKNESIRKYLEKKEWEATPFLTNQNNVNFYPAESEGWSQFCTFKEIADDLKGQAVCFYERENFGSNVAPSGSLLRAISTFRYK